MQIKLNTVEAAEAICAYIEAKYGRRAQTVHFSCVPLTNEFTFTVEDLGPVDRATNVDIKGHE